MKKYPKYKEIVKAYNELLAIVKDAKTIEDLLKISKEKNLTFEVDGDLLGKQLKENYVKLETNISDVEWFRVESYKMLDYIYIRTDGMISFDVWSDYYDNDFIDSMIIDGFSKEEYKKQIEEFEKIMTKFSKK